MKSFGKTGRIGGLSLLLFCGGEVIAQEAEENGGKRQAVEIDPRKGGAIPSTKGILGG